MNDFTLTKSHHGCTVCRVWSSWSAVITLLPTRLPCNFKLAWTLAAHLYAAQDSHQSLSPAARRTFSTWESVPSCQCLHHTMEIHSQREHDGLPFRAMSKNIRGTVAQRLTLSNSCFIAQVAEWLVCERPKPGPTVGACSK